VLQRYLNTPWLALVNSASPWLAIAFATGAMWRGYRAAAVAGLATCVAEVAAYFLIAAIKGYPAGSGFVVFWTACGLAGGPLFGLAGRLWRGDAGNAAARDLRGIGAAALPAAFLAEGLVGYGVRLHYTSSAILFAVVGAAAALALGLPAGRMRGLVRWLVPVLACGIVAELALGLVSGGWH
jgi:Family of unknown function (DUF6518)